MYSPFISSNSEFNGLILIQSIFAFTITYFIDCGKSRSWQLGYWNLTRDNLSNHDSKKL